MINNDLQLLETSQVFIKRTTALLNLYAQDYTDDFIHVFNSFRDREEEINSEIIKSTVDLFQKTEDQHYLVEAAILLIMMDRNHTKQTL